MSEGDVEGCVGGLCQRMMAGMRNARVFPVLLGVDE